MPIITPVGTYSGAQKTLYRGAASTTTTTTLYTAPASTTTIVMEIVVTNTSSAGTFTISFGGTQAYTAVSIGANSTSVLQISQILSASQTIQGGASAATINFHIAGVEVA